MITFDRSHEETLATLVGRTVALLETEYPNSLRLTLTEAPTAVITPSSIYPAFYGCYDWHSAVHSHWQVVRGLRAMPDADFVTDAVAALDRTLTAANVAVEMAWIDQRPSFEMPYGMAWLLRLCRELRDWDDERADRWLDALLPMEAHARDRFASYCRTLTVPMRGGLHQQTAFSLGLVWDSLPDEAMRSVIRDAAGRFFGGDTAADLRSEPSAADFLSPALAEADLLRRILPEPEFAIWLDGFAPDGFDRLRPVTVVDPTNGQLAHWAGLNLSRSWMLRALAEALPAGHGSIESIRVNADAHAAAGLATAAHDAYMISHWVPTFAVYLLTAAGSDEVSSR